MLLLAFLIFLQYDTIFGQVTMSTSASLSTTPPWLNPYIGGKSGNPGANIHVSNKTIAAVHLHAAEMIANDIKNISLANFDLPIGWGTLSIKPPRITEAKFYNVDSQLIKPNRIRSRLYGAKIAASGGWHYKPFGVGQQPMSGGYRSTITDGEVETTSQLGRTNDGKPMVQTIDCKTNFSRFRIDIEGAGNLTTVDSCDNFICEKIRGFFEDAVCLVLRTFVKESINRHLATFPARVNVLDDQYKVDYGVMNNEPRVNDYHIDVGMEGKFLWRGMGSVPFNAPDFCWTSNNRMLSFQLSDFVFNTLFHQAHAQGYRYSAADLLSNSPTIQNFLKLNCTSASNRGPRKSPIGVRRQDALCLGSLLDNFTNIDQFSTNDTGDLTYKTSQKAPSVFVQDKGFGYFDGGVGNLEIYGPAMGGSGNRKLLVKMDVQVIRGDFNPKWNGANITGSIKITRLHVDQIKSQPASMTDEWIKKFSQLVVPTLLDMFNAFLSTYAQFPIPLLNGTKCGSPEFLISPRTMQVDCDLVREGGARLGVIWA